MGIQKLDDDLTERELDFRRLLSFMSDEGLVGYYTSYGFDDDNPVQVQAMADEALDRLEKRCARDRKLIELMEQGHVIEALKLVVYEADPERVSREQCDEQSSEFQDKAS